MLLARQTIGLSPPAIPHRRLLLVAGSLVAIATAASFGAGPAPLLLNRSPSEPPGVYVRRGGPPLTGTIIAFRAPPSAFPYADRRLAYLHTRPLLKAVEAVRGDHVCTVGGVLKVNGVVRGPIASRDEEGRPLPRWAGCRALSPDEVFVFSDRVPNSFDSRYYGPIRRSAVLGVYTLLAALPEARP